MHPAMSDGTMFFDTLSAEELVQHKGFACVAPSLGNGYYVNLELERQADFLHEELVPVMQQTLPLSHKRDENAVLGISMGAYGALRWAFAQPECFSAVAAISGIFDRPLPEHPGLRRNRALKALYGALAPVMRRQLFDATGAVRPEADLQALLEAHGKNGEACPHVRLYCGEQDYLSLPHCRDMRERLHAKGGDVQLYLSPGGHDTAYWRTVFAQAVQELFASPVENSGAVQ